jgi:hypothetical protein
VKTHNPFFGCPEITRENSYPLSGCPEGTCENSYPSSGCPEDTCENSYLPSPLLLPSFAYFNLDIRNLGYFTDF